LTDTLLQSELFGYEAGAFTGAQKEKKGIFEAAGNGTVFLDEFEDVSPKMQSSLLRVLESNEVRLIGGTKSRKINCKLVIATNKPLKKMVANKTFREDLYFRLARFEIKLPALII
jgi:transcriptional regulator with PAS, ATPase and Fis domain